VAHPVVPAGQTGRGSLAGGRGCGITYDPLSSQGIHKAFVDATAAAPVIAGLLERGEDVGESGFAEGIAARFEDYVSNRNYFYDLEARWPDAPFWMHRRERTALEDV
jgi:flavin-dependent dehydrogenase